MIIAFVYMILVVRPAFYFHYLQPPFLLTSDFLAGYLDHPGGLSQWMALLLFQSFFSQALGPVVFIGLAVSIWLLTRKLMDRFFPKPENALLSLLPFTLAIVLVNNYNFPFSILISLVVLLVAVYLLPVRGKGLLAKLLLYTLGAVLTWYVTGSGYLLIYSLISLFFIFKRENRTSYFSIPWVAGATFLLLYLAGDGLSLWFFPERPYFMAYQPSMIFFIFLFSVPLLISLASLVKLLSSDGRFSGKKLPFPLVLALSIVGLAGLALFGHLSTFRPDARKIVASDYYCYHHNAEKVARAACTMENYSFAANVNYNLAISRKGRLTQDFFSFFQISGSDAIHPDVDFSAEMLFIAADFYYDLAYISEARHNAYEALVFYPYSPRALQLLVKIHLLTGEYKAADRCLRILDKGLVSRRFLKVYQAYVEDFSLIASNPELMEKRKLIPEEKELSPYIEERFRDLLDANPNNKLAYEYLMLYHLLEGNLESFIELYAEVGKYFEQPVGVYEEALLMYGMKNKSNMEEQYPISQASLDRFGEFGQMAKRYEGDRTMARNVLYWEMGESYMYYLGFLHPRIVKPEIQKEEYEEAPI